VLSTLHTNDSVSAVARLLDLGVPSSSITGIIAQRLIRRLCSCRKCVPATAEFITQLAMAGVSEPPAVQNLPNGCEDCELTGYKGRIGVYEILVFDDAIRAAIRDSANGEEIRGIARRSGMKLMYEYAMEQVGAGITTMGEVERVVPVERVKSLTCAACQRNLSGNFLFCPYCGAPLTVESEEQAPHFALVEPSAVNQ
jgi:general secretion pathway protein E